MCNIKEDMMYGSKDIKARGTEFFVILGHFLPFYWKLKFEENVTKSGDIILLQMCTINKDHMTYGS